MAGEVVSVLTPSYQYGHFLADALASVRSQAGRFEHVVVDGGSTDDTVGLLENQSFASWLSESDRGQSDALNKALGLASGDWIGWLNADEFYLPSIYNVIQPHFETADVIYGDFVQVDADGRLLELVAGHSMSSTVMKYYGPLMPTCATFIRRSLLTERDSWHEELRRVMDWDLWLKLLSRRARFAYVGVPLGAFRIHDSNVTNVERSRSAVEYRHLDTAYGRHVGATGRVLRGWAHLEHALRKVSNGAYIRERILARQRGTDFRWWGD
ncbi:glycosyltransferase family 2 protein [Blastococcus brunescens]|uniref:Glycosyltransferase family 2 protein n=1 Tax=Blastococcus brunescens TaxID=1564165 RepID=A0ABZ1B0E0_9ACTN|nr:glycosyltransferase family 2 protein [Blastococcus sp. BMG 8361]WRL64286.1 glycosyltransferase family 2 protein [Blastococcus sp. BMG 8361]